MSDTIEPCTLVCHRLPHFGHGGVIAGLLLLTQMELPNNPENRRKILESIRATRDVIDDSVLKDRTGYWRDEFANSVLEDQTLTEQVKKHPVLALREILTGRNLPPKWTGKLDEEGLTLFHDLAISGEFITGALEADETSELFGLAGDFEAASEELGVILDIQKLFRWHPAPQMSCGMEVSAPAERTSVARFLDHRLNAGGKAIEPERTWIENPPPRVSSRNNTRLSNESDLPATATHAGAVR